MKIVPNDLMPSQIDSFMDELSVLCQLRNNESLQCIPKHLEIFADSRYKYLVTEWSDADFAVNNLQDIITRTVEKQKVSIT